MANSENKRLAVDVLARVDKLEKGMAKAAGTVSKRSAEMEGRLKKFSSTVEVNVSKAVAGVNGALSKLGLGGLAAGGLAGLVAGFREVASSVAEIGSEAQRAGLSNKAFQELKFAAEQSRVSVDALTDGMKELSLRTDEFIISGGKSGSAAEAFQRLGYTVDELKQKIKDPSALLTEIIGKVQRLDKAAQVRIFDELFGGTGGEQFVRFIERGESGIRDAIKAANDLGIVINDEVIANAAEVDRQFNIIAATISGNLKSAIVDAFSALASFVDQYRDITNQTNKTIDSRVADLGTKRLDIERKILETQDKQRQGIEQLSEVAKRNGFENSKNPLLAGDTGQIEAYRKQLADLATEEKQLVDERNKRVKLNPVTMPAARAPSAGGYSGGSAVPTSGGGGSSRGGGGGSADAFQRAVETMRQHTDALKAETAAQAGLNPLVNDYGFALEKARASQDLLTAAEEAGLTVTPALKTTIDELAGAYANASVESEQLAESQDRIRQAAEEWSGTARDVTSGFINDLRSGTSAAEALSNALGRVVDKLIDVGLNSIFGGGSSGGGLLGALFGIPGFANGTDSAPGGLAVVGERGPELVNLPKGSQVIPSPQSMRMMRGGQQGVNVNVGVSVDDEGKLQAYVKSVSQQTVAAAAPKILTAANKNVPVALAKHQATVAGSNWRS